MRHIVLAALVALVLGAACKHNKSAEATVPTSTAPKDVVEMARNAIEQWRQAYEARSLDALQKLYAHETDVVVVLDGQAMIGWPSVETMLKDKIARAKEIRVSLKDVTVKSLAPEAASAVATMTREIGDGVTTVTENGALTLVLRKDESGWKIVAEHYSYRRP
jgi:ketosteroid isomerase-like protein